MLGKQRLGALTYDIYWVLAQKKALKKNQETDCLLGNNIGIHLFDSGKNT